MDGEAPSGGGASDRGGAGAAARRIAGLRPAILVVVAGIGWLIRWTTAAPHGTGDAFWYTRLAYTYLGASPADAVARAGALVERLGIERAAAAAALVGTIDPRYQAIFAGRPLFPATGAVLIPVAGPEAMIWSVAIAGVLAGTVLGWFTARVTGSWAAALASVILFYALPTGVYATEVMADAWALLFWVGGLASASLYLAEGRRPVLALTGLLTLLLAVTKSANAAVLAVAVTATALVILAGFRHDAVGLRTRAGALVLVVASITGAVVVASAALGLPGLETSVQDLLTAHFTKPDAASPWRELVAMDRRRLGPWMVALLGAPWILALALGGAIGLLRRWTPWIVPWLAGAAACALLPLAHPVGSEIPRLMSPAWASVALGLAALVAEIRPRATRPVAVRAA